MRVSLEKLNKELYGKVIIKYVDISKNTSVLKELELENVRIPTQVLFNSDKTPYKTTKSEIFGYKIVQSAEGKHVLTLHDGDLTYDDMKEILKEMGMK